MEKIKLMDGFKFVTVISFMMISFLLLTSCNNDDDSYSLDKYWINLATVNPIGSSGKDYTYSLKLDNGKNLWIVNWVNGYIPYKDQRAIINYTILSDKIGEYDHYIRLNSIHNVLTKNAIDLTAANADSIGNDKVKIHEIWSGSEFLNINFGYNFGGTKRHMLNLVKNTTIENPDDGKIYLEFRHNAYDDPQATGSDGIVCFNLKPFRQEGKTSVDFVIKANTFEGEKTYNVTYDYSKSTSNEPSKFKLTEVISQGYE